MPNYLDEIDQEAGIAPPVVAVREPSAAVAVEESLGEWGFAQALEADAPERTMYFIGHPSGYQWRILQQPTGQWLIQDRGVTEWGDREQHASFDEAKAAVEADAHDALAESVEEPEAEASADEPGSQQVQITHSPAEVSVALMEGLDEIISGADLTTRQRAVLVAAGHALRTGVIPTAFLSE